MLAPNSLNVSELQSSIEIAFGVLFHLLPKNKKTLIGIVKGLYSFNMDKNREANAPLPQD